MKGGLLALLLGALGMPVLAQNVACYQQCATRGIDRSQCIAMCDQGLGSPPPQPGMAPGTYPPGAYPGAQPGGVPDPRWQQPGMQPGMQSWQPPSQFNVNQACFEDCRDEGKNVAQCQQQCRY